MGVMTPERRLAAAIVAQAFSDMSATDTRDGESSDTIATQAIRFMTDRAGHAAQWRNRWCSYLDLDGDVLAARVRQILDGEIDATDAMRGLARVALFEQGIARARERWARLRPTAPKASPTTTRLPSIKRPPPPPAAPPPVIRPTIEPEDVDLSAISDDPFYVCGSGHLVASRPWSDGEVSRILGPLPPFHSKTGDLLWTFCQQYRNGKNALYNLGITADAAIQALETALPRCRVMWSSRGEKLTDHRSNAALRLYLKEPALAA